MPKYKSYLKSCSLKLPLFAACFVFAFSMKALAQSEELDSTTALQKNMRIVSLSPHLTELVYLLGLGDQLVAVSDFSDYPEDALRLPRVASYQGANIPAILRLQPTHILVWQGGNKDSDISKLMNTGIAVYQSNISDSQTLITDITEIAHFLNASKRGQTISVDLQIHIKDLKARYQHHAKTVVYSLNQTPLVALGNDRWLNELLSLCGLQNIFAESIAAYPQVTMTQVLRLTPDIIIAASGQTMQGPPVFWRQHNKLMNAKFLSSDPNKLHRFTPRAIEEITRLCQQAYTNPDVSSTVED